MFTAQFHDLRVSARILPNIEGADGADALQALRAG